MCVQDSTRRTGQKKNTVDQRSITHQAENRTVTIRYERGPIMANVVGLPLVVLGYDGCGYYTRAVEAAIEAGIECWPTKFDSREQFQDYISAQNISTKIKHHRSSPVVFELAAQSMPATRTPRNVLDADVLASATFVGGCDSGLQNTFVAGDVLESCSIGVAAASPPLLKFALSAASPSPLLVLMFGFPCTFPCPLLPTRQTMPKLASLAMDDAESSSMFAGRTSMCT